MAVIQFQRITSLTVPALPSAKDLVISTFRVSVGVSVPENGGSRIGAGTPISFNTAFQYRVLKYLWPEVETNYTYWPNGEHRDLSQLFITPGLIIGRIPIAGRVGLTVAAGCQVAVTDDPLYHRNVILRARRPF